MKISAWARCAQFTVAQNGKDIFVHQCVTLNSNQNIYSDSKKTLNREIGSKLKNKHCRTSFNLIRMHTYLCRCLSTVAATATRSHSGLRSGNTANYCLPIRVQLNSENGLSLVLDQQPGTDRQNIPASTSLNVFKRKLKTHLYTEAIN